ncbi:hypothetical protein TNCT_466461 [Trichonephila clavata]|uniref:Uncharacterized protein n=1 Tax=Trichonephila clavata TaxID=2740835 RepID=A0A8X6GR66_TRICU|nr:hypothetical protein TNCT_466461 [Trichonephila clavata]
MEERLKKRKELQEAAKQNNLLANQAPTQTRTQPAQTSNPGLTSPLTKPHSSLNPVYLPSHQRNPAS